MRLDHVNIHVYDLAAARDFLVRLLGVEVGWRPAFKVPGDWLYLDGRAVTLGAKAKSEAWDGWTTSRSARAATPTRNAPNCIGSVLRLPKPGWSTPISLNSLSTGPKA